MKSYPPSQRRILTSHSGNCIDLMSYNPRVKSVSKTNLTLNAMYCTETLTASAQHIIDVTTQRQGQVTLSIGIIALSQEKTHVTRQNHLSQENIACHKERTPVT